MRILFVADVFGVPGRRAVEERLSGLRAELAADFCVVNGENAADGAGITPRIADRILAAGADVITLGNHVWRRPEIGPYLAASDRVIRPANVSTESPGRGLTVIPAADGTPVAVINLLGRLFIDPAVGPFEVVDELVDEARKHAHVILVDFLLRQSPNAPKDIAPVVVDFDAHDAWHAALTPSLLADHQE